MVSSLLASTLGTTIGRIGGSALKAIPAVGTLLGISTQVIFSGASTFAIGKVFKGHFEGGGKLADFNAESAKENFKEFLNIGKNVAKNKEANQAKDDIIATIEKLK